MKTKPCRAIAAAAILAASALITACALPEKPAIEVSGLSEITGRVVALHRGQRTVSLRGPEGNVVTIKVDKAVRNFDQVQVGDEVKLQFYESVAIFVTSDGRLPAADGAVAVTVAPRGARPAGELIEVTDVSATIQAINPVRRVLTLKGPQGNVFPVTVDRSVQGFGALRVGDNVHLRITEALALSVSAP